MRGILALVIVAALAGPAMALPTIKDNKVVVTFDRGGIVHQFAAKWRYIASKGYQVEIAGPCVSACTLVLGIVPPKNICWRDGARFGFHQASTLYWDGKKWAWELDPDYTKKMAFQFYPRWAKAWIKANGPLTGDVIFMGPEIFASHIRRCED